MKVAFTGPRSGISAAQVALLEVELHRSSATELHHGDCQGADVQAHQIGRRLGLWIVSHPPTASGLRALCQCDETRPVMAYLLRNRQMVKETELLIGAPNAPERLRSGTWATIRYAKRLHVPLVVLHHDDTVTRWGMR